MIVIVNGRPRDVAAATTLAELAAQLGRDPATPGTAIARNGAVVPRREWHHTALTDGDTVEVLTAVGGG